MANQGRNQGRPFVIEIPYEGAKKKATNLQEAFEKFREGRQREMKAAKIMEERVLQSNQDAVKMESLRMKFLEGAKKYFGIPYAKRYHESESPNYDSPLFLDCCGLIRCILLDLKEDFGFVVGSGNQAYMYDTLPNDIKSEEDMKPGDLVFISATYYTNTGKKWKKQRHDMVHVEIWAGDGEKTIGARWQKGVVQVFDSYKFVSKSYHSMKYHFKSINTWLMGICKSFCPEHLWRASEYNPGKKSIFAVNEQEACEAAEKEESESDDQQEGGCVEEEKKTEWVEEEDASCAGLQVKNDGQIIKEDNAGTVLENEKQIVKEDNQQIVEEYNKDTIMEDGRKQIVVGHERETVKEMVKVTQNVDEMNGVNLQNDMNGVDKKLENGTKVLKSIFTVSENSSSYPNQSNNNNNGDSEIQNCWNKLSGKKKSHQTSDASLKPNSIHMGPDDSATKYCSLSQNRGLHYKVEASAILQDIYNNVDSRFMNRTFCNCPEWRPIHIKDCAHTGINKDNRKEEDPFDERSESDASSSSLECFEVIADYKGEVDHAIVSCPIENTKKDGGKGAVSPSKENGTNQGIARSPPGNENNKKSKDNPPRHKRDGAKSRMLSMGRPPTFYVSSGNGSSMVESTLLALGWRKLDDRNDYSFKLKWVECKSQIDYNNFREGEQLVNHISNIGLLTTKLGLLCSLQEYERVLDKVGSRQRIQLSDFVPETCKLTNLTEKQRFVNEVYKEGEVWICKPIGQNQGKGIYIVSSAEQLREKLHLNGESNATNSRRASHVRPPQGRVIQRYITNPLLLNGFKFDVRAYMLIASTTPYVVLYHPGYIRVSCVPYSPYSQDGGGFELLAHLTNQYVQKKHPLYSSMKEETVWSFDRIQAYIDEHHAKEKELDNNWMFTTFTKRMQQIMLMCFHSVRTKLHRRIGYFDLLGFDFMIDENFKIWLIEINVNPSLNTNCQVLKEVIPDMVDSTLKIELEIFEKVKKRRPVFPLENIGGFHVLYNGEGKD